jgi:hypothetical protein
MEAVAPHASDHARENGGLSCLGNNGGSGELQAPEGKPSIDVASTTGSFAYVVEGHSAAIRCRTVGRGFIPGTKPSQEFAISCTRRKPRLASHSQLNTSDKPTFEDLSESDERIGD